MSDARRRPLFPPLEPYQTHYVDVGDGHELYVEESGNPQGQPVIVLHGGPGGGSGPKMRRFFNPQTYRIIMFDQRGAGKSRPHASLEHNTTAHLIRDIEQLRETFAVDSWPVFGGSWGSTLALAYAQAHPDRVAALLLRGIFLLRPKELHWLYQHGASELYPDAWQDFVAPIPEGERDNLLEAYHRLLTGDDEAVRQSAARAWSIWEASASHLFPSEAAKAEFGSPQRALSMARIECHYFLNEGFMAPNQLLDNMEKIRDIPGVIVQGRYDVVCPPVSAWELHQAWPKAELVLVPDAGHSAFEPGNAAALVEATERFAAHLS